MRTALQVMRELFHVMVWAAYHHSTSPDAVPLGSQFDPRLAAPNLCAVGSRRRALRAVAGGKPPGLAVPQLPTAFDAVGR